MKRPTRRPAMAVDGELLTERQNRAKRGKRDNLFTWTVFLLLLIGVVFACWIGSFYVFQHPENPRSYVVLRKLKKIDPPKRFAPTLAPNGRFYDAKDLVKLLDKKTDYEIDKLNLELLQAYIGNYSFKELQVPYLMGRFSVVRSQALAKSDLLTSGFVALARSIDEPKLTIEQLYPAEAEYSDDLRQMLQPGVEIKLERTYDLSAVLHVEKQIGDVWQVTIVPLNYDSYGLGDGREVRLSPPPMPNLAGPLPIMDYEKIGGAVATVSTNSKSPTPSKEDKNAPVLARSGPTPDQSVVRVARALPVKGPPVPIPKTQATPAGEVAADVAALKATPSPTPIVLAAIPLTTPPPTATPVPTAKAVIASSSLPVPKTTPSWQTYRPGQMPRGRLLNVPDLDALAKTGGPKTTTYLQGSFVVRANDGNRAVMRTKGGLPTLGLGEGTRVIVEYPEGQPVPTTGAQVSRDSSRPFQITAIRRDAKGQINVFVREVTVP